MKDSVASLLRAPRIRREHLRKYSWLPDVLRIQGSTIPRIVGPVITVTVFAAIIAGLESKGYNVVLTNSVVPLLSVVVGLILVFRNGSSYDRWWEGRKSFASMTSNIRNLSRQVWVNVAPLPPDQDVAIKGKAPTVPLTRAQLHKRKEETLKLCLSFAFAVKHYLRGEDGVHWEDYSGVLPSIFDRFDETGEIEVVHSNGTRTMPSMSASFASGYSSTGNESPMTSRSGRASPDTMQATIKADATKRVKHKRSKKQLSERTPLFGESRVDIVHESIPLPLVIAHEISRRLFQFRRDGLLETVGPAGTNSMTALIQNMVDNLTVMERIANTPIPRSYAIHLKQCVTLYLFALPLTMVSDLGWTMVPIVTVVAFTLMGIEGIADEIEMPFGDDAADLPLDRYCEDLKEEVTYIIRHLPESSEGVYGYDDGEGDD